MEGLLRAHSLLSRALLTLALLAWAGLVLGAPAVLAGAAVPTQSATPSAAAQCAGMPSVAAASQPVHSPDAPAGHADCCHGGCQCLPSFGVGLLPSFAGRSAVLAFAPLPMAAAPDVPRTTAAPPLRPPIA